MDSLLYFRKKLLLNILLFLQINQFSVITSIAKTNKLLTRGMQHRTSARDNQAKDRFGKEEYLL